MIINNTSNPVRNTLIMAYLAIIVGALLGASLAFSSPEIVALTLISLLAVVFVLKNPVLGILGFIALTSTLLDSTSNPGVSIGVGHIYLTDIILFTLFWLIGWGLLTHPEEKFVKTPLDLPLLLFVSVAIISTVIAMLKGTVTFQASLGPIRDVLGYLIFFAITNLVKTRSQLKLLQRTILAFASIVSIVMIIQYALGTTLPFLPGRVEVLSTEGTSFYSVTRIIPPGYSIVFVACITVCAIWFFDKNYSGNIILAIPLALTGIGVVLTFKRNLWASLVILILIMALISRQKEMQRILLRVFSSFAVMLVGLFFIMNYTGSTGPDLVNSTVDRLFSLFRSDTYTNQDSSLRWRDFENEYATPHIVSNPFFGIGLGTKYRPWVPDRDWSEFDGRGYIHNGFYWLLLRTGGIGFLLMMGTVISAIVRGLKYWRILPDNAYVLGFSLALIGMLIGNRVVPMLSEWEWTALIATLLGMNELSIYFIKHDIGNSPKGIKAL